MLNALRLQLFIGTPEYQPCWQSQYGALVVIHNRTEPPLYVEDGVLVQTGAETNFVLNKIVSNKLAEPYSECLSRNGEDNNFNSIGYKDTLGTLGFYSQKWCLLNCSLRLNNNYNLKICQSLYKLEYLSFEECMLNQNNLSDFYPYCHEECPLDCEKVNLNIQTHIANYPSNSYGEWLLANQSFLAKFPSNQSVSMEVLKQSILSISIYYESTNFIKIVEKPESDLGILLGTLGGQLGLLLGVSFLSFAEIFEILFEVVRIFYQRSKKSIKIVNKNPSNKDPSNKD